MSDLFIICKAVGRIQPNGLLDRIDSVAGEGSGGANNVALDHLATYLRGLGCCTTETSVRLISYSPNNSIGTTSAEISSCTIAYNRHCLFVN